MAGCRPCGRRAASNSAPREEALTARIRPDAYEHIRLDSADFLVRRRSVLQVRALLSSGRTLYDAAASAAGARTLAGRAPAFAIETEDGAWVIRHYCRGGALAPLLGDRYLRFGPARAFRELAVSVAARDRGVPTPEVVVAASYPHGPFVRSDIAVVLIPDATDLAAWLFGEITTNDIQAAVERAAALISSVCMHGLVHADLNLKNILVAPEGAYVIDLDRCRLTDRASRSAAFAMRRRFARSLDKWQARTGRVIGSRLRHTLLQAFDVA